MCSDNYLNIAAADQQCAKNSDGREVIRWTVVQPCQQVKLGPATTAYCFPADHISGAVGWREDTSGMGVVFSGDIRFNNEIDLVERHYE